MRVRIKTAGALTRSLPAGRSVIQGEGMTVRTLIRAMVEKHGADLEKELLEEDRIREGLFLLVNGRNVLSLPEKYDTPLEDGDEVLISVLVAGG